MTTSSSTADLLLESLKARRKYHLTRQMMTRVSSVIRRIDFLTGDTESSSLQELFDYFMLGETKYFPDNSVKRILRLLDGREDGCEETRIEKGLRVLNQLRAYDNDPQNRNPDINSIVLHFRGPNGLEGCWLGDIDKDSDIGVRCFRALLYAIEDVIAADATDVHERFYFINKNFLDIADALVTIEEEDESGCNDN